MSVSREDGGTSTDVMGVWNPAGQTFTSSHRLALTTSGGLTQIQYLSIHPSTVDSDYRDGSRWKFVVIALSWMKEQAAVWIKQMHGTEPRSDSETLTHSHPTELTEEC